MIILRKMKQQSIYNHFQQQKKSVLPSHLASEQASNLKRNLSTSKLKQLSEERDGKFVVGSAYDDAIIGNDAVNRLTGGAGNDDLAGLGGDDTIIGGQGNDFIEGGEGDDVFIFEGDSGHDLIVDFEAGEGRSDRIWLQDQGFADFDALQSAITDTDQGAVINLNDSSTVLLEGIAAADLVADDFILA